MRVARLFAGSPAPVAPLPPQVSPRSVTFSMAIDTLSPVAGSGQVPVPALRPARPARYARPVVPWRTRNALLVGPAPLSRTVGFGG